MRSHRQWVDQSFIQPHHTADGGVQSDRVGREKEHMHRPRSTIAGPLPSMATMPSMIYRRGSISKLRSTNICENISLLGMRVWNSDLRMPGMQPNWFLMAPVMRVKAWLFNLLKLTNPSLSRTLFARVNCLIKWPSGKEWVTGVSKSARGTFNCSATGNNPAIRAAARGLPNQENLRT